MTFLETMPMGLACFYGGMVAMLLMYVYYDVKYSDRRDNRGWRD